MEIATAQHKNYLGEMPSFLLPLLVGCPLYRPAIDSTQHNETRLACKSPQTLQVAALIIPWA